MEKRVETCDTVMDTSYRNLLFKVIKIKHSFGQFSREAH